MKRMKAVSIFVCILLMLCGPAQAEDYGYAVVDGGTSDRIHLRALPSTQETSMGLYFTGTEVQCLSDPNSEWVQVVVGTHMGYMMSKFLVTGNARSSVQSKQPTAVVSAAQGGGTALCYEPAKDSGTIQVLEDDQPLTVMGETSGHWCYVSVNGQTGYVPAADLTIGKAPAPAATSWQAVYRQCLSAVKDAQSYMVYDVNGDRIPELLVRTGNCEADYMLQVYTVQNGAAVLLGETNYSHAMVCGLTGTNGFLVCHGQMMYETVEECISEKGGLTVQELYEAERAEYTPYQALTEYEINDLSGLNWQGNEANDNIALVNQVMQELGKSR